MSQDSLAPEQPSAVTSGGPDVNESASSRRTRSLAIQRQPIRKRGHSSTSEDEGKASEGTAVVFQPKRPRVREGTEGNEENLPLFQTVS